MDLTHALLATLVLLLYFAGVELAWSALRADLLPNEKLSANEWWIVFCWFIVVVATFPSEVRKGRRYK